jgi:glycosyltransferase involved in cell wall biosynthesis
MRLLALVPSVYDTSPGQRFRIEQWEPLLRRSGVEITYEPFECDDLHEAIYKMGGVGRKIRFVLKACARRFAALRRVRDFDAVYVFREAALLGPPVFERWAHGAGVPVVFDFDDAVFVPYKSIYNGLFSVLKFPGKTRTICRLAAHVMAGNTYLADFARRHNPRVTIVPTTIDTEKYTFEPVRPAPNPPVIGWSGSFSTVKHLDTLRDALQLLARRERFRLRVIGTPRYELEGVDVEALPWRSQSELADLRPIDIGVMPMPDDAWSRGKCGLKALQYMALGIPTVCSPVGVNAEIIRDGENGLLAMTTDQWVEQLSRLLRSGDLRRDLGRAGRETVEVGYSALSQAPRVCHILESVVASGSAARQLVQLPAGGQSGISRRADNPPGARRDDSPVSTSVFSCSDGGPVAATADPSRD